LTFLLSPVWASVKRSSHSSLMRSPGPLSRPENFRSSALTWSWCVAH